jgi:hypothetical protein
MWKCTTCDLEFDSIPDDAVRLTHTKARTYVYRFSDGAIHALRKIRIPKSESVPPPLEYPKEETELLQTVVEVLPELPKPQPEIKPEPEVAEPEIEDEVSLTPMALAFRRRKEIQN